jgi:PAS domain S-box-containing protein
LTLDELFTPVTTDLRWSAVDQHNSPLPSESFPAAVAMRTGEQVVDFMMGVQPPVGGLRWLEVNAFPMTNSPGTPPYAVVVSMRDVTEKRAAITRIQFQADLLDAVGQAIIADAAGTITYWNHAAEQQCGWASHEALGRNLIELTSSPEMAESLEPIFTELIAGRSWTGDVEVLRRDGTTFPALVTDTPFFDDDGQFAGLIGVATDITERERAEETMRQLSAIVESSADAIMGHTLDGIITSWNRAPKTSMDTALMRSSVITSPCSCPLCPPASKPMCSAGSRSVRPCNTWTSPSGARTEGSSMSRPPCRRCTAKAAQWSDARPSSETSPLAPRHNGRSNIRRCTTP